jgi:hypothetical protein
VIRRPKPRTPERERADHLRALRAEIKTYEDNPCRTSRAAKRKHEEHLVALRAEVARLTERSA